MCVLAGVPGPAWPIRLALPTCLFCCCHDNAHYARPPPYGCYGNIPFPPPPFLADAGEPGVPASWCGQVDCGSVCCVCFRADNQKHGASRRRSRSEQQRTEQSPLCDLLIPREGYLHLFIARESLHGFTDLNFYSEIMESNNIRHLWCKCKLKQLNLPTLLHPYTSTCSPIAALAQESIIKVTTLIILDALMVEWTRRITGHPKTHLFRWHHRSLTSLSPSPPPWKD